MPSDVQIKQFELSDQDALLSFLRLTYPGEPRRCDPTFWKWHFLENPYAGSDDIPVWLVKAGDEIVGQMATIPFKLKVGEFEEHALWSIDFIMLPEYRGRGLGKRLVQAAHETHWQSIMELGHNEQSGAVFRSLNWVELGNINRYHKLLFPGDAVREISRLAPVRHLANLLYAPFRPNLSALSEVRGVLREVTTFDSSFDDLWRDASVQWQCAAVRSSRFLDWQYLKQPGKKFDVIGYYESDRLLGYVVLFFRKAEPSGVLSKAAITDICYSATNSQEVIDALLQGALHLAIEKRAGGLVTDILDARVEQRLRQLGFWRIKKSPPFMVKTVERQELMYDRKSWFLTRGDADISIFEEPNL
jgi:GNAT superfamily N-acetyltransferase